MNLRAIPGGKNNDTTPEGKNSGTSFGFKINHRLAEVSGGVSDRLDAALGFSIDYPNLSPEQINLLIKNGKAKLITTRLATCKQITDENLLYLIQKGYFGRIISFLEQRDNFFEKYSGQIFTILINRITNNQDSTRSLQNNFKYLSGLKINMALHLIGHSDWGKRLFFDNIKSFTKEAQLGLLKKYIEDNDSKMTRRIGLLVGEEHIPSSFKKAYNKCIEPNSRKY